MIRHVGKYRWVGGPRGPESKAWVAECGKREGLGVGRLAGRGGLGREGVWRGHGPLGGRVRFLLDGEVWSPERK